MDTKDNKDLINISHEFKGPVTSLKIILETLYEYDEFMSSSKTFCTLVPVSIVSNGSFLSLWRRHIVIIACISVTSTVDFPW